MYDELAKSLRQCAEASCAGCKNDLVQIGCRGLLQHEAADAIEQLSKDLERSKEWETFWEKEANEALKKFQTTVARVPRWIPVTERLPSDFVSVQAHIVGADPLPTVREAYVIGGKWFFPALKEFLPVDMWKRFDEPPKKE